MPLLTMKLLMYPLIFPSRHYNKGSSVAHSTTNNTSCHRETIISGLLSTNAITPSVERGGCGVAAPSHAWNRMVGRTAAATPVSIIAMVFF